MSKLSKEERAKICAVFGWPGASVKVCGTKRHEKALPVTSHQSPVTSTGASTAQAPPKPAPVPAKPFPSSGANGEFMLAQELGREIKLAMRAGDIALVAQVIANEAEEHGGVLEAKDFIRDRAIEARTRGEPVTVFWLQDRKFVPTQQKDVYQRFLEG